MPSERDSGWKKATPAAAELGISLSALENARKTGKLTEVSLQNDGNSFLYHVENCRTEMAANSDPRYAANGRTRKNKQAEGDPEQASQTDPGKILAEATRQKQWIEVYSKRLEYRRKKGLLINRQDCAAAWAEFMADAKSKLLSLGDSTCAQHANSSDPIECKEITDARVHIVLKALAAGGEFKWIPSIDDEPEE